MKTTASAVLALLLYLLTSAFLMPIGAFLTNGQELSVSAYKTVPQGTSTTATMQESLSDPGPAYHDHEPKEALPPTLDPARLVENHRAFVAYSLAAHIAAVLYQEPCFCHCNRFANHKSLFDCYTGNHGVACYTCQAEVAFCFERHRKGWSAAKIRDALFRGQWKKIDLDKYVCSAYRKLSDEQLSGPAHEIRDGIHNKACRGRP